MNSGEKLKKPKCLRKLEKKLKSSLKRLERMHPESAESAVIRTYLEWLTELPWSRSTKDLLDIKAAKAVLDKDHYDLEKLRKEYLSI